MASAAFYGHPANPAHSANAASAVSIARNAATRKELAKRKIESLFNKLTHEKEAAKKRSNELEDKLAAMDIREPEKERMRKENVKKEIAFLRESRRPMSESDFEIIRLIGRGAFGEVMLVKQKKTSKYFAMKKLRKADMMKKEQVNHAWSERHVLVAADHPFVCQLVSAFQNKEFLYLVMEYLPGGDLMNLLFERDTLPEEDVKFYVAEMVVAIDSIHKLGFIHRDVKPDNLLIDRNGHLKLSDFGLCKSFTVDMDALPVTNAHFAGRSHATANLNSRTEMVASWKRNGRKQAFSTVGTPYYISYEVLTKRGYNKECDYWSLGVVLYEMLIGYPPFYAEDELQTCRQILNWRECLVFPPEPKISWAAKNLIQSLICDAKHRLGTKDGIDDFKSHPFFEGIDWDNLNNIRPPFVPELQGPTDTRYFEVAEDHPATSLGVNDQASKPSFLRTPGAEDFIGFTFKRYNPGEAPAGRREALSNSLFDGIDDA